MHAQKCKIQNFRTDTIIVALSLRRDLGTHFSVDGRLSSFSGELLDDGTDRQVFFDALDANLFKSGA